METIPRRMWQLLEPIHAFIYFVPEASARYNDLGLERIAHYFASRSAAMGAVSHGVVTATFYNFSPGLVKRAMRDAWHTTTPDRVLAAQGLRRSQCAGTCIRSGPACAT